MVEAAWEKMDALLPDSFYKVRVATNKAALLSLTVCEEYCTAVFTLLSLASHCAPTEQPTLRQPSASGCVPFGCSL